MFKIESTRRKTKRAVERIRASFIEWDRIVFKQVTPAPEDAYVILREGADYILAVDDPTL